MDKNLTNTFGWIVVASLVVIVIIALATPFGDYIGTSFIDYATAGKQLGDNANNSFQDQQNEYNKDMNEGSFATYIESGLYNPSSKYNTNEAYDADHEILTNNWDKLIIGEYIMFDNASIKSGDAALDSNKFFGDLVIDNSILTIKDNGFKDCTGLTSVYFKNITQIGKNAFQGCKNIKSIYISTNQLIVNDEAFKDCKRLKDSYFNGPREQFKGIKFGKFSGISVNIHCTDETFSATI